MYLLTVWLYEHCILAHFLFSAPCFLCKLLTAAKQYAI